MDYKKIQEERAALVEAYNSEDSEEKRAEITRSIEEVDARTEAAIARLQSDKTAAEQALRLSELQGTESPEGETSPSRREELRGLVYGPAGSPEARATVTVPSFLEEDDIFTDNPLDDSEVLAFVSRFNVAMAPYKEYTERLHSLDALAFVAAAEATALARTDTQISQFASVSTSKIAALTALSQEVIDEVAGAERQLVADINHRYALAIRQAVVDAVNGTTNVVTAAGAGATVAEAIDLIWAGVPAEDKADMVLLASTTAMADLAKDSGQDNFFFDPAVVGKTIQGTPVLHAPNLGGAAQGDTLLAAVNPRAISVRASGLRVARDSSFYFGNDEVAFRGTAYLGSAINTEAFTAKLVRA